MPEVEEKKTSFIDRLMQYSKKIIIGVVAFAVLVSGALVGLALYNKSTNDPNVVAEVGKEKIYLDDYNKRFQVATRGFGAKQTADAKKYAKEGILNNLVKEKILNQELSKRNISVTEADLTAEAKKKFSDYDKKDAATQKSYRDFVRVTVAEAKLKEAVTTQREGNVLYCRFDRADQDDYASKQAEAAQKMASDKAYALDACTKAKARMEKGESTFQQELDKIKGDIVIGKPAWRPYTVSYGQLFDKNSFEEKYFQNSTNEFKQIVALQPNKDNSYHLLTVIGRGPDKGKEQMFAVVYLKDKGKDGEVADFDKWLQEKWDEYKVKTYLERI